MGKRRVQQPADPSRRTCTKCRAEGPIDGPAAAFLKASPGSENDQTYNGVSMPCIACRRTQQRGQRAIRRSDPVLNALDNANRRVNAVSTELRSQRNAKAAVKYHALVATPEARVLYNASRKKAAYTPQRRLLLRMHRQLRRGRLASTVCDLTDDQFVALVVAYDNCCAYCARTVFWSKKADDGLEIDHLDPLKLGGHHTIENVAPACRRCNRRKNARPLHAALEYLGVSRTDFLRRRVVAILRLRTGWRQASVAA